MTRIKPISTIISIRGRTVASSRLLYILNKITITYILLTSSIYMIILYFMYYVLHLLTENIL